MTLQNQDHRGAAPVHAPEIFSCVADRGLVDAALDAGGDEPPAPEVPPRPSPVIPLPY